MSTEFPREAPKGRKTDRPDGLPESRDAAAEAGAAADRPTVSPDILRDDERAVLARLGVERAVEEIAVERRFTRPGADPFDEMEWETRAATITGSDGDTVFEQADVEVPRSWSQLATNVVASKYFRGQIGTPERERSVRQLIGRVAGTIAAWGRRGGYFATPDEGDAFQAELTWLLLHQHLSFNSPVWFNCGIEDKPQCSACFINSVQDTMSSILTLARTEGMLFKFGSGTGSNLSAIRSSRELLAGGGTASGPVSFMKGYDAFAGVIKSGGKTRRAAKMVILNADHPDIAEFISCKAQEEKKAWALIEAGYDASLDGPAYSSVFFQNANHSVRVTDEFMRAVERDGEWKTRAITTGAVLDKFRARDLLRRIAEAAWQCGDPGMQFDTTVNDWHTCPNTARINASNPCVTGDTLVATADGWRRIDSLVGRSARILGADGRPSLVDRIFPTGRRRVFRLRTRAGYQVDVTGNHRVWTRERGDVAADDLKPGEHLLLQGAGFGRRAVAERLAFAVGVAAGDGCLSRSHASGRTQEIVTLTMAAAEAGVLEAIAGAVNEEKRLRRAVGAVGRADDVRVTAGAGGGSVARLSFSSQPVVAAFQQLAVLDRGSRGKRFTSAVHDLDRPSLAAVLRGLFTADGTVANDGDKSPCVSLDSTSLDLLRQVQLLLLGFEIKAKLYEGRRAGRTDALLPDGRGGARPHPVQEMHSLRISRSSRVRFEREIGFHPASPKAAALRAMNDAIATHRDELTDPVDRIEPLGEEDVFDLTEPSTHHFVANGIVVHNCSEYMFLDDSACNLASLNLMRFRRQDGEFDVEKFRHAVQLSILAQEIIVDNASYPTEAIERNSHAYRPLGLGYANLGALLMARGLPYDSDEGRAYAAAVTALMCGEAYAVSARIAGRTGPFPGFAHNREPMLRVLRKHRSAALAIADDHVPIELLSAARQSWDDAVRLAEAQGVKNAQATVLAPTGTIAFMMDCDTTGIEPDIALVKYKKLVGGGVFKIVNNTVPLALRRLGYEREEIQKILDHIEANDTIEGAPGLRDEHLPVFDCAFPPARGSRSIAARGHVRMMAAAQPFISGAISKTVNLPSTAGVEDIEATYVEAWTSGLKAIAVYRDGCKRTQPLSAGKGPAQAALAEVVAIRPGRQRRKLPDERQSVTHKFSVGGHEGYITVGLYEDHQPGELFVVMAKAGSTVAGFMDSFATAISYALQYGVPLKFLVNKFINVRFEPNGITPNPQIRFAKSPVDYMFRWLGLRFLPAEDQIALGLRQAPDGVNGEAARDLLLTIQPEGDLDPARGGIVAAAKRAAAPDAPPCSDCGAIMVRNGACYACINCGATSGCS
jgi:ribonucleoside-diphosphate reductase alpha chain